MLSNEQLQSRLDFSLSFRADVTATAITSPSSLLPTIQSLIESTTVRYTSSSNTLLLFELDLHDLWFTVITAACGVLSTSPTQDTLVLAILRAREMGTLVRTNVTTYVHSEEAIVADGKIWTNLPYLVSSMREAWKMSAATMSPEQRTNLAAFTARLVASGVCAEQLSLCAIWCFREALEIVLETNDQNAVHRLRDIAAWLGHAGYKLRQLCVADWSFPDLEETAWRAGELAEISVDKEKAFSKSRWDFWMKRLHQVGSNGVENGEMETEARHALEMMRHEAMKFGGKLGDGRD